MTGTGLRWRTGPFCLEVCSTLPVVAQQVHLLYADFPMLETQDFIDFHLGIHPAGLLRRWFKPQVQFDLDGYTPFKPLPRNQAYAMLEWGLNWCVSTQAHRYLMMHAAVLERGGRAVVMPAPPGSGKSTLTAALMLRGWRLFSDEVAILDTRSGSLLPIPKPVSLKNQSIDIIRRFEPSAVLGEVARDTAKGTVGHLKPTRESVVRMAEVAHPGWLVFPKWQADADTRLEPIGKARASLRLAEQGFNYSMMGEEGFAGVTTLVDMCECLDFIYSDLDDAIARFDELAEAR